MWIAELVMFALPFVAYWEIPVLIQILLDSQWSKEPHKPIAS